MKFTASKATMLYMVKTASSVAAKRSPRVAYTSVKITADNDMLQVRAMNGESSIVMKSSRVEVLSSGETLLNAQKLEQVLSASPDDTITFYTDDGSTHIVGKDSRYNIYGGVVDDYPPDIECDGGDPIQTTGECLSGLIKKTSFSVARENSRYAINGIMFTVSDGKMTAVSTDGHRLSIANGFPVDQPFEDMIVPIDACLAVSKVFDDEEEVLITSANNYARFESSSTVFTTTLVDGRFPPYMDVIPKGSGCVLSVDCASIVSALKMSSVMTSEETRGVRLDIGGDGIKLRASTVDVGTADVSIDHQSFKGDDIAIGVNPKYLADALLASSCDSAKIELYAANKPIKISCDGFLSVLMPVNLS